MVAAGLPWMTIEHIGSTSVPGLLPGRSRSTARYRRAVRARGHFPSDQAALKCLYLVTRSLDPTGQRQGTMGDEWKPALNAFAITFEGRIHPAGN